MDDLIKKGFEVVDSCKTVEQLSNALNYVMMIGKKLSYSAEYQELHGYASGKVFREFDKLADLMDENLNEEKFKKE